MRTASLLALLVVAAGCDSTPAVTPPEIAPVLPLAVGAEWTFARSYTLEYDEQGAFLDTTRADRPGLSLTIPRDTVVAGETWFLVESTADHCVFTRRGGWFANRADGLYRLQVGPEGTADAERVYAIGVPDGTPFLTTNIVTAVLTDDDATADLPSGPATVRQYDRTWKRLVINPVVRGPIDPMPVTQDLFSPERGPVALEVSYVRFGTITDSTFTPVSLVRYDLTTATRPASARVAPEADGLYPVR